MVAWIYLSLVSAVFLGLYDVAKKAAVRDNAVAPVLLLSVLTAAGVWAIPVAVAISGWAGGSDSIGQLARVSWGGHAMLLLKSALVGASWTCAFYALKHLPISVAAPIRSTSPVWTILIAVSLMGERPGTMQWLGIAIVLIAFSAFSLVGAKEGILFHRDRAVTLMVIATLLGSASALYDKYLLQTVALSPLVVQAWFSLYLVPIMMPLAFRWWLSQRARRPFTWRWSIPLIAVFLLVSDLTYFMALSDPDALISVVSPLRRASILIAFSFGIVNLRERNWAAKAPCIVAILAGVFLLSQ